MRQRMTEKRAEWKLIARKFLELANIFRFFCWTALLLGGEGGEGVGGTLTE